VAQDILGTLGFIVLWSGMAIFNGYFILMCFLVGNNYWMLCLASLAAMVFLFGSLFSGKNRIRWFILAFILSSVSALFFPFSISSLRVMY